MTQQFKMLVAWGVIHSAALTANAKPLKDLQICNNINTESLKKLIFQMRLVLNGYILIILMGLRQFMSAKLIGMDSHPTLRPS